MKTQTLLLSLLFGSGAVLASEPVTPSHPGQLIQDLQHGHEHAAHLVPKPPRLVSPNEFKKVQAKLHAQKNRLTLADHLIPDADKAIALLQAKEAGVLLQNQQSQSSCTSPDSLLPLYGQELVNAVENASLTSCLYKLYNNDFTGSAHFADEKILTIVQAVVSRLAQFDGSNASGAAELEKLVSYLRAMHWVEGGSDRQFSAQYQALVQQALDTYFAGEHFVRFDGDVSRNFMLRYEMLVLVSSSGADRLRYMKRFSQSLTGYARTVSRADNWGVAYEENGVTQLLTHYFNASTANSDTLPALLLSEPEIINNLRDFVMTEGLWLVDHTRQYQWSDAVTELARLLKFGGSIADSVRPAVQHILATYQYGGSGSNGWVNAQGMVKLYDSENCHLYGNACDFDLENTVLSGQHTCGDTLKVRYQEPIAATNLQQICHDLAGQEQAFHQVFGTANKPVGNDNNTDLEIVIFSSSTDYQNYAGTFFEIDTNNGGMYLEGTPSDPTNQARFIAYQATWLQPEFVVWNLEHEYVHYLDGRFNQWGSFSDQPADLVWWGEGLAEYLSKGDDNPTALAAAPNKTYQLSELFQTTYANSNTARTYHWGYLATRFMFERYRPLVDQELLPTLRAIKYVISDAPCSFEWGWKSKTEAINNNWSWLYDDSGWSEGNWVWTCGQPIDDSVPELPDYTPYAEIMASWGTRFDAEFHDWLDCIVSGEDCRNTTDPVTNLQNGVAVPVSGDRDSEQQFSISLPANAYDLKIITSGGSGDVDLYVRQALAPTLTEWDYRPWVIGNKERVEVLQPEQSQWYVMLHGYRSFSNATVTASWKEGTLTSLQQWPSLSGNHAQYQWVYIPPQAKAMYVTLSGGSGDAQLYVKRQGWPAVNNYDAASSITRGTTQKIYMQNIVPGSYYHIMVNTLEGFSDVNLDVLIVE